MKSRPASSSSVASFSFSPIFLSPTDYLSFAHSISSGLINCDTATLEFVPRRAEQQEQAIALQADLILSSSCPLSPRPRWSRSDAMLKL